VASPNVHAIAIDGTFDDCQDLVKAMFADARFRAELALSAVNSINWARSMGLPISQLVIGTNRNDILARFINDGAMTIGAVEPSLSPSMDIQVSSNFERLYFEL